MKLTYEEIIAAGQGYVRVEQNELGVEFHRFSREQEGFLNKTHPLFCRESFYIGYFGKNCRTAAGITLDFVSDAREVEIRFARIEYPHEKTGQWIDLYVDRELVQTYKNNEETILYAASGGTHRYTLYFPYLAFPIVSEVELKGATVFSPVKRETEILFLGDSITHGGSAAHPSNTYVMRVARALDVGIINQGNSAFVYDADSIDKVCDPKLVVTAYGINDYGRKTNEQLESQTAAFLQKVREVYPKAKILSILPLWTAWDEDRNDFQAEKRAILRAVYEQYSDVILDGYDMIPNDVKYLADELVHPNDEGFAYYGSRLTEEIRKMLA